MNITLLALIDELNKQSDKTQKILSNYNIGNWQESKIILHAYQDLINKLETAKG